MAWRNVDVSIFGIPQSYITDFSLIDNPSGSAGSNKINGNYLPPADCGIDYNTYIWGNESGYSLYCYTRKTSSSTFQILGRNNGSYDASMHLTGETYKNPSSGWGISYICAIDDATQKGFLVFIIGNESTWAYWTNSDPPTGGNAIHYELITNNIPILAIPSNGGGATHIAKVTGQLSSLSNNLSDILMVSGGGGGGLLSGDTDYSGKEAGGISGSGDNSADQSTGNAFGQGESGTNVSGGGSGLYGGYKGTSSKSGGAGSGYIGNSLLSNKKMVGYNVPTSSAESTKTESVNEASESPVSGKPKIGNGYARIKLISEYQGIIFNPPDSNTYLLHTTTSANVTLSVAEIKERVGTGNFILFWSNDAYYVARLNNTENDIYLCDREHVGLAESGDQIFINGTTQKENYKYAYDTNSNTFVITYGTQLNFSAKTYDNKTYIYYPVENLENPQIGVFTSHGALYINNIPVVS